MDLQAGLSNIGESPKKEISMMDKKFKVQLMLDSTYEVFELNPLYTYEKVFQGSLADCEAYIRLRENENVEFY
jgi:hypothetical protein